MAETHTAYTDTDTLIRVIDTVDAMSDAIRLRARSYELLNLTPGATVVEVACGTARAVAELAATSPISPAARFGDVHISNQPPQRPPTLFTALVAAAAVLALVARLVVVGRWGAGVGQGIDGSAAAAGIGLGGGAVDPKLVDDPVGRLVPIAVGSEGDHPAGRHLCGVVVVRAVAVGRLDSVDEDSGFVADRGRVVATRTAGVMLLLRAPLIAGNVAPPPPQGGFLGGKIQLPFTGVSVTSVPAAFRSAA